MGLLMANEAELLAKERAIEIRKTLIPAKIKDIRLGIEEEMQICAVWCVSLLI